MNEFNQQSKTADSVSTRRRCRQAGSIMPPIAFALLGWLSVSSSSFAQTNPAAAKTEQEIASKKSIESRLLSNVRQLTFEGRRSGEGYYSADGRVMVFQSERQADNPFYQIYTLDFETGDIERVSPGHGKTTCAWIHPGGNRVLFASTHDDPEARGKQKAELEFRESGQTRRYSWDYDPTYELYSFDRTTNEYQQLTDAKGYDAEGSYSPDGKLIAFASNRNGFGSDTSDEADEEFARDPSIAMEIYIAHADGSNVKQLTDVRGYDGGPFFSPNGERICWRRFAPNGLTAEIMTMNIDGSDQQQITRMNAMSWAPFYHPSGEYLIFTTNKHGFENFELYLVAADGKSPPVRVTDTDGFDGLASFSPDGKTLTWTSTRNARKQSQIYLGKWDHEAAMKMLSAGTKEEADVSTATRQGVEAANAAASGFDQRDLIRHVDYLCRKELGGRMTGSIGERKATAYVAAYLDHLGLLPAGDNGGWYQKFDFPDGARLGSENGLTLARDADNGDGKKDLELNTDWRPLTFSANATLPQRAIVFAGYGIVAPETEDQAAYDSYADLDVKGKWAMVFRFVPEDVTPERRQHLQFHAGLRKKAFQARQRGAAGLIVVCGPNSQVRKQLVPLQNDFSPSGSSLAAVSVSDEVAQRILDGNDQDLKALQASLDAGEPHPGFVIKNVQLATAIDVIQKTGAGRNVLGRLQAGEKPSRDAIIVGAHIDHLGAGKAGSSLAKEAEQGSVHVGADDNASGVAAMLEIAEYLADAKKSGKLNMKRDIIFAAWSGEELGLHGSKAYANSIQGVAPTAKAKKKYDIHDFELAIDAKNNLWLNGETTSLDDLKQNLKFIGKVDPKFPINIQTDPTSDSEQLTKLLEAIKTNGITASPKITTAAVDLQPTQKSEASPDSASKTRIVAALNMDMVGRFKEKLVLQGIGSSDYWARAIEQRNAVVGLPLTLSDDTDLPTDASSFYRAGVPILSAFTGSHTDYHTPRDTPEKLNYPAAVKIARLMGLITRQLVTDDQTPKFVKRESKPKQASRGGNRAYLGTVPSYGDDVVGVKLEDTTSGAPAALAGVQGGDIIIGLAGQKIENIYDYTAIIDGLKINQETTIRVKRGDKEIELKITPQSRQ
jgi:Tol biopolymer transport system component